MATNFTGPLTIGSVTGRDDTDTRGWVSAIKIIQLSQGTPRGNITIPGNSVAIRLGFVPTSAFTGDDPVSAMNITFTRGTEVMGVVTASAATRHHQQTVVSAAIFDTAAVVSASLSALSTTVFTGGGGRAFIEFLTRDP